MESSTEAPFIVVTAILDATARPAKVTVSHGDAIERAYKASGSATIAGIDIIELPIRPQAFAALREHTGHDADSVGIYDLFPLAPGLSSEVRKVAGQFLAAEVLWALDEGGHLSGVPLNVKLDLPKGWDPAPKAVHERLIGAGALELSSTAINTYKNIKQSWDAPN